MDPNRLIGDLSKWTAPVVGVTAVAVGVAAGLGPALLVLAGGVLLGVVLLFWSSIGRLTGESPLTLEEAIGLAAPSPEEERKRSILRALKDLEYERSVGKISEEDFAELSNRYRADAKALLKLIDGQSAPLRRRAEERLAARLKQEKTSVKRKKKSAVAASNGPAEPEQESTKESEPEAADAEGDDLTTTEDAVLAVDAPAAAPSKCPSCSTSNDADAVFCKKCGVSLGKPAGAQS
jgi:hypothetical protein